MAVEYKNLRAVWLKDGGVDVGSLGVKTFLRALSEVEKKAATGPAKTLSLQLIDNVVHVRFMEKDVRRTFGIPLAHVRNYEVEE